MTIRTREQWLTLLSDIFRDTFRPLGSPLPEKLRVSCGWPSIGARNKKSRQVVGECWSTTLSVDGHTEIFISPLVSDSILAGSILVHELVHAAAGVKAGHGPRFKRLALAVGLAGPMRATHAGADLRERLNVLISDLGPYPHSSLDALTSGHKKQGTRMKKVVCPACGYTVRTTAKWLESGLPVCPCGTEMAVADEPGEEA